MDALAAAVAAAGSQISDFEVTFSAIVDENASLKAGKAACLERECENGAEPEAENIGGTADDGDKGAGGKKWVVTTALPVTGMCAQWNHERALNKQLTEELRGAELRNAALQGQLDAERSTRNKLQATSRAYLRSLLTTNIHRRWMHCRISSARSPIMFVPCRPSHIPYHAHNCHMQLPAGGAAPAAPAPAPPPTLRSAPLIEAEAEAEADPVPVPAPLPATTHRCRRKRKPSIDTENIVVEPRQLRPTLRLIDTHDEKRWQQNRSVNRNVQAHYIDWPTNEIIDGLEHRALAFPGLLLVFAAGRGGVVAKRVTQAQQKASRGKNGSGKVKPLPK
ncbi:hypothetical protein FB451DRAFT_1554685 [Mycena latifolia]|nr:hypothetical protein FB451DRAFT_1554685 [Mycena latifolia]